VNSNNSPLRQLYTFWEKDHGLRRGVKIGNGSPPTVKNRAARSTVTKSWKLQNCQ
jgi:hypothetical protein